MLQYILECTNARNTHSDTSAFGTDRVRKKCSSDTLLTFCDFRLYAGSMRQSRLFTRTRREAPKDETAKNAVLLTRAGFIHKEMAGVYSYLPLGLKVLKNIEHIIREEMNSIGGQEVLLTTLQDPEVWKKSGRWDDAVVDNWFKTSLLNGGELGIANTHEEPLAALLTNHIHSYRDLPLAVYQFQTKFRNELRARSGIMRVREFIMKDLYSFSRTPEEFKAFYESCATAYLRVFDRVGIGNMTYRTVAAGGSFTTDFTDEFQTVSAAGEDTIYVDRERRIAVNKDVLNDETIKRFNFKKETLEERASIEVGNIFPLGTKYPEAFGLTFRDEHGNLRPVIMGSYGIGLGRLMGTIAEVLSDEKGLVWPERIAPYDVHVLLFTRGEGHGVHTSAEKLVTLLEAEGMSVLYDDREETTPGEKLADSDLIGIPWRVVVSDRTVDAGGVEVKRRNEQRTTIVSHLALLQLIMG